MSKSPWDKNQVNMRFNSNQEEMLENDRFQEHLEKEYAGFTDFVETKMREEFNNLPTLEDEVESLEQELERKREELKDKKQKLKKQNRQHILQEKRKELRSVQEDIKYLENNDVKSESEIREEKERHFRENTDFDVEMDETQELIDRAVQDALEDQPDLDQDLDELKQRATELQSEISELNGGPEDWFIQIEEAEVKAV